MDRKEIKALAKTKVKGNKWNIWWPLLLVSFVQNIVERIFGISMFDYSFDFENMENFANFKFNVGGTILSLIIAVVFGIVTIAYKKYVLNIVRGEKFEFNDIINCIKNRWSDILLVEVIMGVIIYLCSLVFVIPGIIMALAARSRAFITSCILERFKLELSIIFSKVEPINLEDDILDCFSIFIGDGFICYLIKAPYICIYINKGNMLLFSIFKILKIYFYICQSCLLKK